MQPEQITNRRADAMLEVLWDDGAIQQVSHRQVREACKCSHCHAARLRGQPLALPSELRLDEVRQVGHYAVQLVFSDGHDRGIYPWQLLRGVGA
jgi:DUF971 family protein